MSGSVIVSSARTPIGKLSGALAQFSAMDLGGVAIQRRPGAGRDLPRRRRLRDHGSGAAGRAGPDHGAPGRVEGRHPDERAGDHHQQGVPLGGQRALPRGPDDPGRRRRHRGRRGHGVHDQRALPPAQGACRLSHGQRGGPRRADPGRPVVRVRRGAHGFGHRALLRRLRRPHPRGPGRARGQEPRPRRPRR